MRPERVVGGDVVIQGALDPAIEEKLLVVNSSSRRVRWNRSISPVVVGDRTAVSR
jgi:hypothetical protein